MSCLFFSPNNIGGGRVEGAGSTGDRWQGSGTVMGGKRNGGKVAGGTQWGHVAGRKAQKQGAGRKQKRGNVGGAVVRGQARGIQGAGWAGRARMGARSQVLTPRPTSQPSSP